MRPTLKIRPRGRQGGIIEKNENKYEKHMSKHGHSRLSQQQGRSARFGDTNSAFVMMRKPQSPVKKNKKKVKNEHHCQMMVFFASFPRRFSSRV
jgi:hypothetical protein